LTLLPIAIPEHIRALLSAANYVHLATLRRDGSPRNWVVWVGLEGDRVLVCTDGSSWKARDMRRDPRVGLSVVDFANPYQMAALQGRVIEVRSDADGRYMDAIAQKYTGKPFASHGANRICAVIEVDKAGGRTLPLVHNPG
jgi:PPOX class probable F420-dependent enzyme